MPLSPYAARQQEKRASLLAERARFMRSELTPTEALLWEWLRAGRLHGVRFQRQVVIGRFIVDFCAPSQRLVVEVDGLCHSRGGRPAADTRRDAFLASQGYAVLRFTAAEVEARVALCVARVLDALGF